MVVHPKMICNFSAFLIRIPADFFVKIDKLILKSWGRVRNSRKPNCHEKEQNRRSHTSQFQNRQQGNSNQDRDACTGMSMDKWDRTENRNNAMWLWPIDFLQVGKNSLFNNWCWENWISTCRRTKIDTWVTPFIKANSE